MRLALPKTFQLLRVTAAAIVASAVLSFAPAYCSAAETIDKSAVGELNFWNAVKASSKPADIKSYLDAFPNGMFFDPATARYRLLTAKQPSAAEVNDSNPPQTQQQASRNTAKKAAASKLRTSGAKRPPSKAKTAKTGTSQKVKSVTASNGPPCKNKAGKNNCTATVTTKKKRAVAAEGGGGGGGGGGSSGGGGWN